MTEWCRQARVPAFGFLHLKPWEFDKLSIFVFFDMITAWQEAKTAERWERAYWVANIMSPHLKKPVKPATLMKPFEKKKTKQEIIEERESFFDSFERQREEVEKCQRKR